ncbi:MAG: lytic transglycosylase domain-containing protein [Proteobacteria bacterium]|nr:lytic transglycosylase domain-containing protein [Pseudomonadota bacterium]
MIHLIKIKKTICLILGLVLAFSAVANASTSTTATKGLKSLRKETRLAKLDKKSLQKFDSAETAFAVLSEKDIKTYKKLFKYQRALKRGKVAKLIPRLESRVLYGHLMAERLLHSKTKSPYKDLKLWLKRYSDHFQARTIYKLANKRKPRSASHNKPKKRTKSIARYSDPEAKIKKPVNKNIKYTSKRTQLVRRIDKALKKDYYKTAENLLKSNTNRKLLGDSTYTKFSMRLVKNLFYKKRYKASFRISQKVAKTIKPTVYEAVWFEGVSSYNLGLYHTAARAFRRIADNVPARSKYYSRSSYWAGLSYKKARRESVSRVFFKQATKNQYDFYGMLAKAELGQKPNFKWKEPSASKREIKTLLNKKQVQRVVALAEIGEYDLAQKELRAIYSNIPYGMDEALLKMSLDLNLPWNAKTLSHNLLDRNKEFLTGLFPDIKMWKPKKANVDISLLNAIIRQESSFSPSITSSAGAMGLMQIMPGTAKHIRNQQGKRALPKSYVYNPVINVKLGQFYLGYLLEEFNGNLIYSIAAYNAGLGNVKKWVKKNKVDNPVEFIESIPFHETRGYVKKVMANYWVYRTKFGRNINSLKLMSKNRWPKDRYSIVYSSTP